MSKDKQKSPQEQEYVQNDTLPSLWIDSIAVSSREDGISLIGFYTHVPSGLLEQTRIMTKKETLMRLVDTICENLNYTPPSKKKEGRKKRG